MSYLLHQILNGLSLGSVYALIALGFAMVYGVLKLLNFAHSEVFTTATFIAYFATTCITDKFGDCPWLALGVALIAACAGAGVLAVLIERVAYRPLRGEPKVSVLLSAIGISILLQNTGIQVLGARTRGFPPVAVFVAPQYFAVILLVASFLFLWWLVHRTMIGIKMRAVAENVEVVELMGVNPNTVVTLAFFFGGAFAGLAGVTWGVVYGTVHPQMGFALGLKSFIIAVLGGIGSLTGTFVVGLALGLVEALVAAYVPSEWSGFRDGIILCVLLATLAKSPAGLFRSQGILKV
jgi:branched-chain amino acid transport system permease protein